MLIHLIMPSWLSVLEFQYSKYYICRLYTGWGLHNEDFLVIRGCVLSCQHVHQIHGSDASVSCRWTFSPLLLQKSCWRCWHLWWHWWVLEIAFDLLRFWNAPIQVLLVILIMLIIMTLCIDLNANKNANVVIIFYRMSPFFTNLNLIKCSRCGDRWKSQAFYANVSHSKVLKLASGLHLSASGPELLGARLNGGHMHVVSEVHWANHAPSSRLSVAASRRWQLSSMIHKKSTLQHEHEFRFLN